VFRVHRVQPVTDSLHDVVFHPGVLCEAQEDAVLHILDRVPLDEIARAVPDVEPVAPPLGWEVAHAAHAVVPYEVAVALIEDYPVERIDEPVRLDDSVVAQPPYPSGLARDRPARVLDDEPLESDVCRFDPDDVALPAAIDHRHPFADERERLFDYESPGVRSAGGYSRVRRG